MPASFDPRRFFTTRLDAAAPVAPPPVVLPSYHAVVGTLLELHYYFNVSKNHDDPKQLLTTSKPALYHLCSSRFDGFWGLYRHCSRLESVRFLGSILDTPSIPNPGWSRRGSSSPPPTLCCIIKHVCICSNSYCSVILIFTLLCPAFSIIFQYFLRPITQVRPYFSAPFCDASYIRIS